MLLAAGMFAGAAMAANTMPGKGIKVSPVKSSIAEETFQTLLVMHALKDLGYEVEPIKEVEYATAYLALANGDATFLASSWQPLHDEFYDHAGGDAKMYRKGIYSSNALQGYLIDKKTADKYKITNIAQLKDPKIAKLFDVNGNGKADLAGCNPGWGCEGVIENQLDAYKLRATVTHNQGSYSAIIADTLARFKHGDPILYYTWTPYWLSAVLVPGRDVVFLQVPFSSQPKPNDKVDTRLPDGSNYGFQLNNQHIVANLKWANANPAAAKLFSIMQLPNADINAENLRMTKGENKAADIERHTSGWIAAHKAVYDGWLAEARKAAK
ncbi:glycine betaine/L-proline ABC transporter substrate-binding protein ProX [Herbaspirillum sp. RTI4]|uniref:glycine betaine/L-proline ABC transporter substrate-binding protein ProX n=1 Tax=Herbaspirillum sp. RTI4 TaxID=3048640 RepID=UPI002AB429DF|nr:glycine betaine/L-proline ABC transporter substrate-binding protein ProX [Herbaspirillum sp. RTI4]MDY7578855.1 glycine betaine/L-proline ABC transporter substrate-binding protein ProX [Herbaspirillum sp. RTI4]MEA9982998.1 glycine betaine/L-proline ABC transporter substrate-binding protein ProX [Herbaspirillum sp. RTI4]